MFRSIFLRSVLPLLIAAGVVAFFGLPYVDRLLRDWFSADMELRARLVMSSLEDALPPLVARDDQRALSRYANKVTVDQRVLGILICRLDGKALFETTRAPATVSCPDTTRLADGHSDDSAHPYRLGAAVGVRPGSARSAAVSGRRSCTT